MQQPPNQEYPRTDELCNIPLEEQLVIDELVEFWQTHDEPRDLTAHIRGTLKPDYTILTWFFILVRDNLRNDKHSEYAASSASEFRQFLEAECRRLYLPFAERQAEAQAKEAERQAQIRAEIERQAQEREERIKRARVDFDALGELMAKTTDRKELTELGRRREDLAPYIGIKHPYESVCWKCHSRISSTIHVKCKVCSWYICNRCGSCEKPICGGTYALVYDEAGDPFLPDYPDDLS